MKSYGEPAIVAVRERLSRYHGGKITPEQPPKGESSSNGKVEEAGKTTRSLAKVFKDMIESKIGEDLQSCCSIMSRKLALPAIVVVYQPKRLQKGSPLSLSLGSR